MSGRSQIKAVALLGLCTLVFLWGCGSSKSVSTKTTTTNAANSVTLTVGSTSFANAYTNAPYTTITICQPGTSNCTTLDNILVDSGSSGLRILASELPSGFTLNTETSGSDSVYECLPFLDSYTWGNVVTADLELAGEKASSLPVQLITTAAAPSTCSSVIATTGSPAVTTESELGARGILGIGNFISDCGNYCTTVQKYDLYFACSNSSASSCSQVGLPLAQQVNNPVASFASDNNGVVIQFASVPTGGASSAAGTMYFGVGTQADNTPPSGLTFLGLDSGGDFVTTFQSTSLANSFADTGSDALFFGTIDTSTLTTSTGITGCNLGTSASPAYFYCPSSELSETAKISGATNPSSSTTVSFHVGNAKTLNAWALSDIAGPNTTDIPNASSSFDWGMPFFYGRTVYIGLEGSSSSLGSNLYLAF